MIGSSAFYLMVLIAILFPVAYALSNVTINYFNRLVDVRSFDKSNTTSFPNAMVLASIPRGTKLTHFRLAEREVEDPLWFCLDPEFCELVFRISQPLRREVFEAKKEIRNILLLDGLSTFLNDMTDYFLFGEVFENGSNEDFARIRALCEMFPNVAGFARQLYGFELALCNRTYIDGPLEMISENYFIINATEAASVFPQLLTQTKELGSEFRLKVEPDSLLLFAPDFVNGTLPSFEPCRSNLTYLPQKYINNIPALRRALNETLRTPPIETGIELHAISLVKRFSLAIGQLFGEYSNERILSSSLVMFGAKNDSFENRVQRCADYYSWPENEIQTSDDQVNLSFSFRYQNLNRVVTAVAQVAHYLCVNTLNIYANNVTLEERRAIGSKMIEELKWKEFLTCSEYFESCVSGISSILKICRDSSQKAFNFLPDFITRTVLFTK